MKYLVLLAVVGLVIWWLRRGRSAPGQGRPQAGKKDGPGAPRSPAAPTPMLACAHCGVHLPQAEAVTDGAGRPFCGEAHRLAGPR
jgi:uncharacterized protein